MKQTAKCRIALWVLLATVMVSGCKKLPDDDIGPDPFKVTVLPAPSDLIPYEALGGGKIVFDRIAGAEATGFHVIDIDKKTFTGFHLQGNPCSPSISPDGSKIACAMYTPGLTETYFDIYLMNPDGSECSVFAQTARKQDRFPTWSPDGSRVFFYPDMGPLKSQPLVAGTGSTTELLAFQKEGNFNWSIEPSGGFSGSIHGELICSNYSTNPGTGILKVDIAFRSAALLLRAVNEHIESPAYSPDGGEIAFLSVEADSAETFQWKSVAVRKITAKGTGLTELCRINAYPTAGLYLLANRRWNVSLCWSPDGQRILFTVPLEKEGCHLFVIKRNGTGLRQVTTDPAAYDVDVSWGR